MSVLSPSRLVIKRAKWSLYFSNIGQRSTCTMSNTKLLNSHSSRIYSGQKLDSGNSATQRSGFHSCNKCSGYFVSSAKCFPTSKHSLSLQRAISTLLVSWDSPCGSKTSALNKQYIGASFQHLVRGQRYRSMSSKADDVVMDDPEMKDLLKEIAKDFNNDEAKAMEYMLEQEATASTQKTVPATAESVEVLDIDEELKRYDYEEFEEFEQDEDDEDEEMSDEGEFIPRYPRGKTGVYDAEELVQLIQELNGIDICVIKVPKAVNYVDYLCIVTGRSSRHLLSIATEVKWMFKQKRESYDVASVAIEGEKVCHDWLAMDLGNIALHLFMQPTREKYDLETLWTVGSAFDKETSDIPELDPEDPFAAFLNPNDSIAFKEADESNSLRYTE